MSRVAVTWLVIGLLELFGWADFRAHARAIDGVDGVLQGHGLDDVAWIEAA
jgi:hypothetical protein